jgi:hypothetical protein
VETLTPSCCGLSFWITPLLLGSGKFGTPFERKHRAKARELDELVPLPVAATVVTVDVPALFTVDESGPPHAERAIVAVTAKTTSTLDSRIRVFLIRVIDAFDAEPMKNFMLPPLCSPHIWSSNEGNSRVWETRLNARVT